MRKLYSVEGNSWGWLCVPLSLCTSCSEKSRATGLSFNVTYYPTLRKSPNPIVACALYTATKSMHQTANSKEKGWITASFKDNKMI